MLLPSLEARVAIEQAAMRGWLRWVGDGGAIDGRNTFGASAASKMPVQNFGLTPDAAARVARERVVLTRER